MKQYKVHHYNYNTTITFSPPAMGGRIVYLITGVECMQWIYVSVTDQRRGENRVPEKSRRGRV